ncbi:MAG: hypothetical protein CTY31_07550 [Hyphomicrobium sp.]|nr:MAG: hypothetical protein CTY39_05145 [Hyphomicrobium sp.]PPC99757.1 MAG: hypothetical protein CTY31_07550 [Hyphomicrobium sp.]
MSNDLNQDQLSQLRLQLRALSGAHEALRSAMDTRSDGFAEAQAPFSSISQDERRFGESVQLMRAFAAIENADDRRLLLTAAALLAQSPED